MTRELKPSRSVQRLVAAADCADASGPAVPELAVAAEVPLPDLVTWVNDRIAEARVSWAIALEKGPYIRQRNAERDMHALGGLLVVLVELKTSRGTGGNGGDERQPPRHKTL